MPFPPQLIFTIWDLPPCSTPTLPVRSPFPCPVLCSPSCLVCYPYYHPFRYPSLTFFCMSYLESTCKPSTTAHTCLRDGTRARTSLDCSSFAEWKRTADNKRKLNPPIISRRPDWLSSHKIAKRPSFSWNKITHAQPRTTSIKKLNEFIFYQQISRYS